MSRIKSDASRYALAVILALGFVSTASAHTHHHHRSNWRAIYAEPHRTMGGSCEDFDQRSYSYINGCGEYIPSPDDPASYPGNG